MDATLERRGNNYTHYFLIFKVGLSVSGTSDSMEWHPNPSCLPKDI